jgi:outer membrane protein OmpA-like peptidoglycan-associated protein
MAMVAGLGVVATGLASPVAASLCPAGWTLDSGAGRYGCKVAVSSAGTQTVTVPTGVTLVKISAIGARGGYGGADNEFRTNLGQPGPVGYVSGALTVSAGDVLRATVGNVGGNGGRGTSNAFSGAGGSAGTSTHPSGGYRGGAGAAGGQINWSGGGGGGGAASVVDLNDVTVVVAAGGGGVGGGGAVSGNAPDGITGSFQASGTIGGSAVRSSGDGGGGAGGGGGLLGGRAGLAPSGDFHGGPGSAGSNLAAAGMTSTTTSHQAGSIELFYDLPPVNTSHPTIPADIAGPQSATGSAGTWSGVTSYTYQWLRCTSTAAGSEADGTLTTPSDCELITGATSTSYAPGIDDLGTYLRLAVTGTNSAGSVTAISETSGAVSLAAPTVDLESASDSGVSSTDNLTNDTTPTFSATDLVIGGLVTFTATKGSDTLTCGPVSVTADPTTCTFDGVVDGTWNVSATQAVGSTTSPISNVVAMTIDTLAPVAPSGLSLASSSDTGASTTDLVTYDTTPTIDLTGLEVGSRVVVTASKPGSPDVTCEIADVTSASQSCTFATPLGADGDWTFTAIQIDDAGNTSLVSDPLVVTIDTSAGVELTSVPTATGASATAATSFTFTATLTDPPAGATSFTSADISIAGTSTGWSVDPALWTQISPTEYSFTVSAASPTLGTLIVTVPAGSYDDLAGNSATATVSPDWTSTIVVEAPANTAPPVVSALTGTTTTLGSTLTSTTGTWDDKGDIAPVTSYQWQICDDSVGTNCVDVLGATGSTWVATSIAEGKYVRSVVTRTNVVGETEQSSNIVGPMTKSPQQVNFDDPADRSYSPPSFTIAPTSTFPGTTDLTGLTVQMASLTPDVCTVSGFSVTMLKAGTCTLTADQAGTSEFQPATPVTHSFVISRATDTSVTTASASQVEPGDTFTLSTSNNSTGDDSYTVVSGPCAVVGNVVTSTGGTGDCVISTASAADDRYSASTAPNITVKVRDTDAITMTPIDDTLVSFGSFAYAGSEITAVSGRTPTVDVGPTGVCTYANGEITAVGIGTCTVTASLTDDGTWSSASATESFEIVAPPAAPTITAVSTAGADGVLGETAQVTISPGALNGSTFASYTITATPVGGGTPVTATCTSSPCTVTGLTTGVGYTFEAVTNATALGSAVASTPSSASTQVTVLAAHPITFGEPGPQLASTASFSVAPVSDVDDSWIPTVMSTTPSVCQVTGMTVTLVGVGTCILVAEHAGGMHGGTAYGLGSTSVSFDVMSPVSVSAGPPVDVTAVITGRTVTVTWSPPVSSGSFPVTTYQVISSLGQTCLSTVPSCTLTAPAPGQGVTYTVRALTGAGWSSWSEPVTAAAGDPEPPVSPCPTSDANCVCPCDPDDPRDPEKPAKPEKPAAPIRAGDMLRPPPPSKVRVRADEDGRKSFVRITLPSTRGNRAIESVVVAVLNAQGNVVRRIVIDVEDGDRRLTRRVTIPEGGSVRVYTTNRAGVSNRAPEGANVVEDKTIVGKREDGRPILYGKKIAKPVFFGPDSPELDARARAILDDVARYVGKRGGTVLITGFVRKGQGSEKFRQQLSSARAVQVATYLSELGVNTWIRYDGAGAYREIDPRVSDRRVEIRWAKTGIPVTKSDNPRNAGTEGKSGRN